MDAADFAHLLRDVKRIKPRQLAEVDRVLAGLRERAGAVLALETEADGGDAEPPLCRAAAAGSTKGGA